MLATGVTSVSFSAFLGLGTVDYAVNNLLMMLVQIMGVLVAVSFAVTRLVKVIIK